VVLTFGIKNGGIPDKWNRPSVGFSLVSVKFAYIIFIRSFRQPKIIMDSRPNVAFAIEIILHNC